MVAAITVEMATSLTRDVVARNSALSPQAPSRPMVLDLICDLAEHKNRPPPRHV